MRTTFFTGLVALACLAVPAPRANADDTALPIAVVAPTFGLPVLPNESDAVVRIRLVEELQRPASSAAVSLPTGSNGVFTVEVKRSALSAQVLAAAFAVRSHFAAQVSKNPKANIVVYIPDKLPPRSLSPSEQLMFEGLVEALKAQPTSGFVEVSAG
jgi:hypothetical protein